MATARIAEVARHDLRYAEVPVPLKKAQNARTEKLRTIRDGLRHLIYIISSRRG